MLQQLLSSDYVRTVVAVAQNGGFSAAASQLRVSQSLVSQQVRKVEEVLGRRLFERNAHRFAVTQDGEAFLAFAQALIGIGDAAEQHFMRTSRDTPLRIGLLEGVARTLLMRVLALFAQQYPQFLFDIDVESAPRLFAGLDEGRYDIVLSAPDRRTFRGDLLRRFPLAWIGARQLEGPLADPVRLVLPPAPEGLREAVFQALSEAGRSWRIVLQSASFAAVEAAVSAGLGVSVMVSEVHLQDAVFLDETCGLPALPHRDLVIDRRRDIADDRGLAALYDLLRAAFDEAIKVRHRQDATP